MYQCSFGPNQHRSELCGSRSHCCYQGMISYMVHWDDLLTYFDRTFSANIRTNTRASYQHYVRTWMHWMSRMLKLRWHGSLVNMPNALTMQMK